MKIFGQQENDGLEVAIDFITSHIHKPHWHEVILFLVSIQNSKDASTLIRIVLSSPSKYDQWLYKNFVFAGKCLAECSRLSDNELEQNIVSTLSELVLSDSFKVSPKVRSEAENAMVGFRGTVFSELFLNVFTSGEYLACFQNIFAPLDLSLGENDLYDFGFRRGSHLAPRSREQARLKCCAALFPQDVWSRLLSFLINDQYLEWNSGITRFCFNSPDLRGKIKSYIKDNYIFFLKNSHLNIRAFAIKMFIEEEDLNQRFSDDLREVLIDETSFYVIEIVLRSLSNSEALKFILKCFTSHETEKDLMIAILAAYHLHQRSVENEEVDIFLDSNLERILNFLEHGTVNVQHVSEMILSLIIDTKKSSPRFDKVISNYFFNAFEKRQVCFFQKIVDFSSHATKNEKIVKYLVDTSSSFYQQLDSYINEGTLNTQFNALKLIGEIGIASEMNVLKLFSHLQSDNPLIQCISMKTLTRLSNLEISSRQKLIEYMTDYLSSGNRFIKLFAIEGLIQMERRLSKEIIDSAVSLMAIKDNNLIYQFLNLLKKPDFLELSKEVYLKERDNIIN